MVRFFVEFVKQRKISQLLNVKQILFIYKHIKSL